MGKVLFHSHHTRWQLGTAYSAATLDLLKYFRGQITWPKCYNFPLSDLSILSTDHDHFSSVHLPLQQGRPQKDLPSRIFFSIYFYSPEHSFSSIVIFMAIACLHSSFWVVDDVSGLDKIKCSCNTIA